MAKIKAPQVFTPGAFPEYTYVERGDRKYETLLRDALETPGQLVSLSGPSKSGKTVLVERVVGKDHLIAITGAGIEGAEDIWDRVLDWMGAPQETSRSKNIGGGLTVGAEGKGQVGIPFLAKGEASANAGAEVSGGAEWGSSKRRRGMLQVIEEIANSEFVVLIDDFHYMPRTVQEEVAKQIKEAVRRGVKIIVASVSHRSDDVVRALPELRGRVTAVDLDYWEPKSLRQIPEKGFGVLRATANKPLLDALVTESAGSPQLMQLMCLMTCFELDLREEAADVNLAPTPDQRRTIFERTAAGTEFRSLVDVLDDGPKTRGTERRIYTFKDGTKGDVYRCILKALAADPPRLSFPYQDILDRVHDCCEGEGPVGSSITGSCLHMGKLAAEKFPRERALDWDEQKLVFDIPDPYLLFYLRWSGRLMEAGE